MAWWFYFWDIIHECNGVHFRFIWNCSSCWVAWFSKRTCPYDSCLLWKYTMKFCYFCVLSKLIIEFYKRLLCARHVFFVLVREVCAHLNSENWQWALVKLESKWLLKNIFHYDQLTVRWDKCFLKQYCENVSPLILILFFFSFFVIVAWSVQVPRIFFPQWLHRRRGGISFLVKDMN